MPTSHARLSPIPSAPSSVPARARPCKPSARGLTSRAFARATLAAVVALAGTVGGCAADDDGATSDSAATATDGTTQGSASETTASSTTASSTTASTTAVTDTDTGSTTATGTDTAGPGSCPDVPGFDCAAFAVNCDVEQCGEAYSLFDASGCMRPACSSHADCTDGTHCYQGVGASQTNCSDDATLMECSCISTDDFGPRPVCVDEAAWPNGPNDRAREAMLACALPEPCPFGDVGLGVDAQPSDTFMGYTDLDTCVLQALIDRQPAHLQVYRNRDLAEWANNFDVHDIFVLPGGEVRVSVLERRNGMVVSDVRPLTAATLEDVATLQTCLDATDLAEQEACLAESAWLELGEPAAATCG